MCSHTRTRLEERSVGEGRRKERGEGRREGERSEVDGKMIDIHCVCVCVCELEFGQSEAILVEGA